MAAYQILQCYYDGRIDRQNDPHDFIGKVGIEGHHQILGNTAGELTAHQAAQHTAQGKPDKPPIVAQNGQGLTEIRRLALRGRPLVVYIRRRRPEARHHFAQ